MLDYNKKCIQETEMYSTLIIAAPRESVDVSINTIDSASGDGSFVPGLFNLILFQSMGRQVVIHWAAAVK